MSGDIRIGRIAGIDIKANWSLILIFLLITWGLASGGLSGVPGRGTVGDWVAATLASVLFFAALLAHELGHALLAQRRGLEVEGITLWVFGGVSTLKGESQDARDEFQIALIGPVVSLVVAGLFEVVAMGLAAVGAPALVVAVPRWLALVNVVLAVFNLLPAFPLDGGRVFRAWLWKRSGDRAGATRAAAAVGRFSAYGLMGLGVALFAMGATINGIWLVILGWFLLGAARAEESHVLLAGALRNIRVRQVMSEHPVVLPAEMSVQDYVSHAMTSRFTSFPVADASGHLVGLLTMRRVKAAMAHAEDQATIGQIAIPLDQVPILAPDDPASRLLEELQSASDGRALVIDGGALVGIVSPTDLQRMLDLAQLR